METYRAEAEQRGSSVESETAIDGIPAKEAAAYRGVIARLEELSGADRAAIESDPYVTSAAERGA